MNEEMIKFHDAIFKNRYKSYYNAEDIAILDEYRTVVNIGMIQDLPKKTKLVEIDRTKAFTAAFMEITKVPVFNEFDIFKPYNNEEFKDLSLYVVKAKTPNFFLNKDYNLVYGKHLSYLRLQKNLKNSTVDFDILAFKEPSQVIEVNFKKPVLDLFHYSTKISEDQEENAMLKKLIANVNYGLLEKGQNKKPRVLSSTQ
jgi:hypothetical protein